LQSHSSVGIAKGYHNPFISRDLEIFWSAAQRLPVSHRLYILAFEGLTMDLAIWLPAMFVLGLATLGLIFAFVAACERV
jgi:hypothetical protein